MTTDVETVTIRPGAARRWLWPVLLPLLGGCLLFGAAALGWRQRFHAHDVTLLTSFLLGAVVLFVQTVFTTRAVWRLPEVTLTLAPSGLTLHFAPAEGTVAWDAVEAFGLVRDDWAGQTVGLRLRSYDGFAASQAPALEALRRVRGYEVQVPRRVLDGSVDEFLDLLDEYLERYGSDG